MGDVIGSGTDASQGADPVARARRQLVWTAVVAVVAVVVVVGLLMRPGSSSDGSSVSVVPSPDASLGGDDLGAQVDAACTPEQAAVLDEVQAALPWGYTVTDDAGLAGGGDSTCLGPMLRVEAPYADVVATLPSVLEQTGIRVSEELGGDTGSSTTFTGTSRTGESIGVLVADDQGTSTVIGVTVAGSG